MEGKHLTPHQACWATFLSSFNFAIVHTPGKMNPADPASRRPDYIESSVIPEALVLFKKTQVSSIAAVQLSRFSSSFDISFS
ncbi:hypothetical protein CROQUDRAFT_701405 [Cronartium quercuum f. sp. fusiforme G11]|uniref:Uncharacterized protein n=1 Tax=Cronartium quercuum f. sp. fusiforme G11 TaxID=708437 RepID=A0A9P6NTW1_9BASI|nr:hypothetical protein CROQUDRAFT_701405 [Cronartium quercuum f. sp. fusiforme G11]